MATARANNDVVPAMNWQAISDVLKSDPILMLIWVNPDRNPHFPPAIVQDRKSKRCYEWPSLNAWRKPVPGAPPDPPPADPAPSPLSPCPSSSSLFLPKQLSLF